MVVSFAVHMNRKAQVLTGCKKVELFLQQKSIGTQIDVLLPFLVRLERRAIAAVAVERSGVLLPGPSQGNGTILHQKRTPGREEGWLPTGSRARVPATPFRLFLSLFPPSAGRQRNRVPRQ